MDGYDYTTYSNYYNNYSSYSDGVVLSGTVSAAVLGVLLVFGLIALILGVITVIGMWKAYSKAGKPGWASIIPVYREIVQLEIAGRPAWWVLLMMLVPLFGLWVTIVALIDLAKSYGKSGGFAALLIIFPFIAWPILGFGSARYVGPVATGRTDFMPVPSAPVMPSAQPAAAGQAPASGPETPATPSDGQPTPPQNPQA